ncbi:MAG: 50S ribosomal protein L10 [bacterium]
MPLTKDQKKGIINELSESFAKQKAMVFIDIFGLKNKDLLNLRSRLRKVGAKLTVAKKTLAGLASKEKGIDIDFRKITGEAAIVFGFDDEVAPMKAVFDFVKLNPKTVILGGYSGDQLVDSKTVNILAQIPPKPILLSRLLGSMKAPVSGFYNVLSGNLRNLVVVLGEINKAKS